LTVGIVIKSQVLAHWIGLMSINFAEVKPDTPIPAITMPSLLLSVDYYQPDESKARSPERIAVAAKCTGIEPKIMFKNVFVRIAYNHKHQLEVAKQVSDFIDGKQDIRLLVVNNLTKFFSGKAQGLYCCYIERSWEFCVSFAPVKGYI